MQQLALVARADGPRAAKLPSLSVMNVAKGGMKAAPTIAASIVPRENLLRQADLLTVLSAPQDFINHLFWKPCATIVQSVTSRRMLRK